MSLRTELQQAVTQRDRAVRNGYSQRQDHSRLRVALIRAQKFLNSYPVAKDERVAAWCKQHEDDVRIIVMGNHNERLKKLLQ